MEGSEDAPGSTSSQNSVLSRAARRKTDLMPTIPSSSPSHSRPSSAMRRTPGRAFSMSRLDILATPRQPQLPKQRHSQPLPQQKPLSENSMSRSMSHLAVKSNLRRNDTHRSMTQLGPIPPPRPTRAERLRRRAREAASNSPASGQGKLLCVMSSVVVIKHTYEPFLFIKSQQFHFQMSFKFKTETNTVGWHWK